ncbi:hypothetical protein FA13DRAFT_1397360 [Coprinellus micaceus]|uniref:Uncharacterized protein n=1 Tax=Coprinellus micaceus TaxID=71717 RepID=A0A4Y7SQ10_COPMI|nr:hypothetical protein FA13DRAFT_1397360 [Coprinellus micaceus]
MHSPSPPPLTDIASNDDAPRPHLHPAYLIAPHPPKCDNRSASRWSEMVLPSERLG